MRKIVHGIYIPLRTRTMVRVFYNPIHNRVAHVHIRRSHIDFRPQYHRTFFKFALIHALEQIEIFFYGTIAIRATYSGLCRCSLLLGDLFRSLLIYISISLLYHTQCQIIQLREIIRCIIKTISPVKAQPVNIFHNRIDIFHIFPGRIGIVKTQITCSSIFRGNPEIHANSLCMTYMQIAVRLGRKPSIQTPAVFTGSQIGLDSHFYKIQAFLFFFIVFCYVCHSQSFSTCRYTFLIC